MSVKGMNWANYISVTEDLLVSQRLILFILGHHHHDRTNACFPAVATIAKIAGLSERQVQKNLQALQTKGLIRVSSRSVEGRQRSNHYTLFGTPTGEPGDTPQGQ